MGKLVSIHSFQGDTEKSNLVANIANQGKHITIVGTNIQSPNTATIQ